MVVGAAYEQLLPSFRDSRTSEFCAACAVCITTAVACAVFGAVRAAGMACAVNF